MAKDGIIMRHMFVNRSNWAERGIKRFQELAPNLKLLAFEPDAENFKMHRLNVILNDMDDVATI